MKSANEVNAQKCIKGRKPIKTCESSVGFINSVNVTKPT